jgi:hypothetical protein
MDGTPLNIHIGMWDWVMLVGVSSLATVLAYVKSPTTKAAIAMFPVPFTLASLALGRPVSLSNVVAVPTLVLYYIIARTLYSRARWPIVLAIMGAMVSYAAIAMVLVGILPSGELSFWVTLVIVWLAGYIAHRTLPRPEIVEYRSTLAVPLKFMIVSAVVGIVMVAKAALQGFASVFPMLGTIAVYETRHSLSTLTRQATVLMFTMMPMLAACHLSYKHLGLGGSLVIGWGVHLCAIWVAAQMVPAARRTA